MYKIKCSGCSSILFGGDYGVLENGKAFCPECNGKMLEYESDYAEELNNSDEGDR